MKTSLAFAILAVTMIVALVVVPKGAGASPSFYGPIVGGSIPGPPIIMYNLEPIGDPYRGPTYPYVAAFMDTGTTDFTVQRVSVTVSFPNTPDPSVIGKGNWLAAGMFVEGEDSKAVGQDYGFFAVVILDNNSLLWLKVGEYVDTEASNLAKWPPTLYGFNFDWNATWWIRNVDRSTPITLTMSWDPSGSRTVNWFVTINSVVYSPAGASFNVGAIHPTIIPGFYVGVYKVNPLPLITWYCDFFQFGIMSPTPITKAGWQVQFMNPQYYNFSGYWFTVAKATSVEGHNAWYDNTWQWGGRDYTGVSISSESIGTYRYAWFSYSGTTEGNGHVLWQPMGV